MNFGDLINGFIGIVFALGISVGDYQTYKFVRHEVIVQSQRGLPSLEKFSRQLIQKRK